MIHLHPGLPLPAGGKAVVTTPPAAGGDGRASFFFGLVGAPFHTDTSTSLFRMVESALRQGHRVTVWTCGHATGLSQTTLMRPRENYFDREQVSPNTAELIQALFRQDKNHGLLEWFVCRYCMEERGTTAQIPEVKVKIPFSFQHYLSVADVTLIFGIW